jgi:hypothetical protein
MLSKDELPLLFFALEFFKMLFLPPKLALLD